MRHGVEQLTNPFYSPFEGVVLIKGRKEGGQWIVYLEASNEARDQEGEKMDVEALQKAKHYYLTHGVISWDHKHKQTGEPRFIIGEPLDVRFAEDNRTLVKGFLYQKNKIAQDVWSNIQSGAKKLGASVGGGILQKSNGTIRRVVWDETAITHKPINDETLGGVSVMPFAEFAKALSAGGGVDAAAFTGGRALTPESLQGNVTTREALRSTFDSFLKAVRTRKIQSYNDMVNFVYDHGHEGNEAVSIINYLSRKIPDVVRSE